MDEMNQFDVAIMKWIFRGVALFFVIGAVRHLLPIALRLLMEILK